MPPSLHDIADLPDRDLARDTNLSEEACILCGKDDHEEDDYSCWGRWCNFCYRGEDHRPEECDA